MNSHQLKLDECYLLFQNWWKSTELTNYEKCALNNEIISFNQQLFRLKEKIIRVGVYGKTGVGKSTLVNILSGLVKKESGKIFLDGNVTETFENEGGKKKNRLCYAGKIYY